ncbi:hypothetical protein MRB53_035607 [Persea americana]|uniref:Uncharacterized protein n=1 Tax=Persea americana TaxID=3435 RepID=A0ACC2K548_PERAE|nr:hypothetical protein MRB53_035607 [Persea americana]
MKASRFTWSRYNAGKREMKIMTAASRNPPHGLSSESSMYDNIIVDAPIFDESQDDDVINDLIFDLYQENDVNIAPIFNVHLNGDTDRLTPES